MNTALISDPRFLEHEPGATHPECPQRLSRTLSHLAGLPWMPSLKTLAPKGISEDWLETVHGRHYIKRAQHACLVGEKQLDCMDVGICAASFDVALLAAGGLLVLADEIVAGHIDNGLMLARPPGHHAESDQALGFCLFNNVAVLAHYLRKNHALDKILILDWDVHHGNGTQHAFEDDPAILYISTHQYPFYPGTGAGSETGTGRGRGATLNCPMPAGSGDKDYERTFMEKILPKIDAFKPEFVLISAGFDAHTEDPLGQLCLSTDFYGWMTLRVMEMAEKHCQGRIISTLEGGYNLTTLPLCVAEHLRVLSRGQT